MTHPDTDTDEDVVDVPSWTIEPYSEADDAPMGTQADCHGDGDEPDPLADGAPYNDRAGEGVTDVDVDEPDHQGEG